MKKIFYGITIMLLTVFICPLGANATTTADASWKSITDLMKNNKSFAAGYEEFITITSDDTKMIVTVNYDFDEPSIVTYYRYNDMVTFESANTTNDMTFAIDEAIINLQFLYAVVETYGYDRYKFTSWIEDADPTKLNYADDGIEFTVYSVTSDDYKTTTFKNLKINIDCGISAFEERDEIVPEEPEVPVEPEEPVVPEKPETPVEPEEPVVPVEPEEPKEDIESTVENPNTGLYVSLGVVGISLLSIIILAISKKKSYFSKI